MNLIRPQIRRRIALFLMPAIFFLPVWISTLRGLGHAATCSDAIETPFTVEIAEDGVPHLTTSRFLTREATRGCDGLEIDITARQSGTGVLFKIPIRNETASQWVGTVRLEVDGESVPLQVGTIAGGTTEVAQLSVPIDSNRRDIDGTLYVGP